MRLSVIVFLLLGHLSLHADELFTFGFPVPRTFLPHDRKKTAQQVLEDAGITFGEGASATYSRKTGTLVVRNTKAQLDLVNAYVASTGRSSTGIKLIVEFIEVDRSLFAEWIYKNRLNSDGTELRNEASKWITDNKATILDTTVISSQSGQRTRGDSVEKFMYPTVEDPPMTSSDLSLEGENTEAPVTTYSSTGFDMRNIGTTVEIDPVLGADGYTIDVNLAPGIVRLTGYSNWPPEGGNEHTIKRPVFHHMKVTTQITITKGRYGFIGTATPHESSIPGVEETIVLFLIRADVSAPKVRTSPVQLD